MPPSVSLKSEIGMVVVIARVTCYWMYSTYSMYSMYSMGCDLGLSVHVLRSKQDHKSQHVYDSCRWPWWDRWGIFFKTISMHIGNSEFGKTIPNAHSYAISSFKGELSPKNKYG